MQHEVVIDGTKIQYWEFHPEKKATIFFWHGFRGSHRGLVEVAELLSDYRLIIPDLPGWGESGTLRKAHTFTNYVVWLKKFIAHFGIDDFVLAGHSFGASLALIYAASYPEHIKQLLLIAPVVNAGSFTSRLGELYYAVGAKIPQPFRRKWIANPVINMGKTELISVTVNPIKRQKLVRNEQKNLAYIRDWVEIETYQSFYDTDFWQAMKSLTMPTTLISATRDRMTSMSTSRRIAATISECRTIFLKNDGHFVPIEHPTSVAKAMQEALVDNIPKS